MGMILLYLRRQRHRVIAHELRSLLRASLCFTRLCRDHIYSTLKQI